VIKFKLSHFEDLKVDQPWELKSGFVCTEIVWSVIFVAVKFNPSWLPR
jgi:hypothetical protein